MSVMSMGKVVMLVVGLTACGEGGNRHEARFPDHRKQEEKRISDLEAAAGRTAQQVSQLQDRIAELEKQLKEQPAAPAANPPP